MIHKLVRDRIPDHIRGRGARAVFQGILSDDRLGWLQRKLLEECLDVRDAAIGVVQYECADVLEVLLALVAEADRRMGTPPRDPAAVLEALRREKADRDGTFRDGVILIDIVE